MYVLKLPDIQTYFIQIYPTFEKEQCNVFVCYSYLDKREKQLSTKYTRNTVIFL